MSSSIAMNGVRCAASRRATIWPKRPKPAISTCGWLSGIVSNARFVWAAGCAASRRDTAITSSGVSAIDRPTAATSRSRMASSSSPALIASPNTTKANSPPSASTAASCSDSRVAQAAGTPADREQQHELDRHEAPPRCAGDQPGLGQHALQVDAHAHGHEEQAQQQALERIDLRFEFVAEFRIGQQHAGEERAQARRQARRPASARPRPAPSAGRRR